jgi:hypothetical protein
LCIVGEFIGKKLERNMATELYILGFIHHTHSPSADLAQDAVMGNGLPNGLGRCSYWRKCYGEAGEASTVLVSDCGGMLLLQAHVPNREFACKRLSFGSF